MSVRGATKLHPSLEHVPSGKRHVCQRGVILLPLKHLSSNCIICTLFYCLTIEQFLLQASSEMMHT